MVLWSQGKTRVLCTASVQERVPRWLYRSGRGWMTAEYSLLPASTGERTEREAARGKQGGRTVEIQRLIGRALRGVVDFEALGERTVYLDCDVLQADGGTRCAAISGAYVAAHRALDRFGLSKALTGAVAAVSVGVVDGEPLLDLDYSEDSNADVDVNVVMTADGRFVEVQATAENVPFDRERLDELLDLAVAGIEELALQEEAIAAPPELRSRPSAAGMRCCGSCRGRARRGGRLRARAARPRGGHPHAPARLAGLGALHDRLRLRLPRVPRERWCVVRADPSRIAAQIVTGIGFLGAGAIIREGLSVRGLTTAATLWVVAAIGMACGAGYYWPAAAATVLTLIALWPLRLVAYQTIERIKPEENRLIVELAVGPAGRRAPRRGRRCAAVRDRGDEADRRVVQLELRSVDEQLVAQLSDLPYVIGVRWRR